MPQGPEGQSPRGCMLGAACRQHPGSEAGQRLRLGVCPEDPVGAEEEEEEGDHHRGPDARELQRRRHHVLLQVLLLQRGSEHAGVVRRAELGLLLLGPRGLLR
eukprot:CAMPEP_0195054092 /NCGR_PEP_ID=MMETSP0448-20130528/3072_1 /TAXON_ID=66468 /ORGANISM="Heterocapsa triquestra, Strain CCMP 448" /LENGTH=102 /DNA_ID=CAMNT_0040083507 /DNA_START=71 /DNA_END=376 /DNA_ORIENTATION=+